VPADLTPSEFHGTARPAAAVGSAPQAQTGRFYLPELDSLRFFAFLAVFICHAFPHETAGYSKALPGPVVTWIAGAVRAGAFGVDLFFLLSSFLITSLLVREHRQTGRIDVPGFWIRRCLRIWPLYILFVVAAGGVLPIWFHFIPKLATCYALGLATFTHNWVVAFCGVGVGSPTLILWSVSLEEQFYLLWPVVIVLAGVKRLPLIAVWMIVFSIVARVVVIALNPPELMLWCATPLRLEPIALGALLALAFDRFPHLNLRTRALMLVAGAAIPILFSALPFLTSKWVDAVKFPAVAAACGLVLLAVVGAETKVFRLPLLVYLGKISYGLYVFHLLAIQFSPRLAIPGVPFGRAVSAFAVTVALAAVSYQWYERPFLRLKDRFAHVRSRPA